MELNDENILEDTEEKRKLKLVFDITARMKNDDLVSDVYTIDDQKKIVMLFLSKREELYWLNQKENGLELLQYAHDHNCLSCIIGLDKNFKIGDTTIYKGKRNRVAQDLQKSMYGNGREKYEINSLIRRIVFVNYHIRKNIEAMDEEAYQEYKNTELEDLKDNPYIFMIFSAYYGLSQDYTLEELTEINDNYEKYFTLPYDRK